MRSRTPHREPKLPKGGTPNRRGLAAPLVVHNLSYSAA